MIVQKELAIIQLKVKQVIEFLVKLLYTMVICDPLFDRVATRLEKLEIVFKRAGNAAKQCVFYDMRLEKPENQCFLDSLIFYAYQNKPLTAALFQLVGLECGSTAIYRV